MAGLRSALGRISSRVKVREAGQRQGDKDEYIKDRTRTADMN